jgi:type IV pilus assembly protein PilQ
MRHQAKCNPLQAERSAKSTELFLENIKQSDKGVRLCALYSVLSALFIMFVVFGGCATAWSSTADTPKPLGPAVITGITIQDNSVTITADKPFVYTIYKPGDPYKAVVDLPDVRIGAFSTRMTSDKAGITEIRPSQIESPSLMARLEILLQSPAVVAQDYKNNVLTIKLKEDVAREEGTAATLKKVSAADVHMADPPPVQKQMGAATEISNISIETYPDSIKVFIKGNGSMTPNVFPLDDRLVLDIADVAMKATVPSTVVSPLAGIRSGTHEGKVRLVLDLKEKTPFDVTASGDSIVVTLKRPEKEQLAPVAQMAGERAEAAPPPPPEAEETEESAKGRCEAYLEGKENVNFDFQNQDIVPILRLFADISGCNLFIHPDVKGRATMKFRDVPWNQALDTLLKTFSLGKSIEGNIIRIAPLSVFAKESEEKMKAAEASVKAEPLETKIFPISYADVSVVEAAIRNSKILTPRGSMSVDKRTSTMVVKDVASVFPEIENLLATLDRPTPQVLIEARIVEINTAATTDLGIQWGLNLQSANGLSSFGGLSGVPNTGTGPFTGHNFLVDFPAKSVAPLSGSGFAFGIMNPSKTFGLDLQLSAFETVGLGKVISNPKVLTLDNGKAKILQGKSIPVRKLTTEGTISTEFKDVTLELNVTPHITPDKSIVMALEIRKEELDPTVPSVEGVPGTDKKEADTNVIIKDGETVVIGGMYKVNTNDTESGVPGLRNIPVIGWLFKDVLKTSTTSELLIFITPRIVEKP